MHGASAWFGGTLALRPLEFSPLHVKTLGACRSGKKKLTVRHSRASKVSVRHCRPVPCVQFLLLVASVNGWSRAQRLCRSSVAQATCELSVVWKGMSVEFLMDVAPEGGVRDHLVVTSRWPGERQLGDSSRPVVGARSLGVVWRGRTDVGIKKCGGGLWTRWRRTTESGLSTCTCYLYCCPL